MNGRLRPYVALISALAVAVGLAACGGGGGGGGGASDQQEVLDPFTPAPPPTLATTFDDRTFAVAAGSGDVPSVLGNADVVVLNNSLGDLSQPQADKTVTAVVRAARPVRAPSLIPVADST